MKAPGAPAPHLTLVIPIYNGLDRLANSLCQVTEFLDAQAFSSELVLVDDGNTGPGARILREFVAANPCVVLIRNEINRGKGASVARGMLAGRGAYRVFIDADLAYPLSEVAKILRELETGADVAIACRVLPDSRYLMSPSFFHYLYTRHVLSRTFNLMVRTLLLRDVLDTQAGLKGFTARAAELIFPRLTIPRFGFDVEALYVAQHHGLSVRQTAVNFRYENEPTTVRFARAGVTMALDLVHMKLNDWRGRYA
ncbi:MAG TPA: glycosyltransferase [Gemmatimonadaceae bacterium]